MKYRVWAAVSGTKYLGEVEADSPEEAEEKAWDLDSAYVSICHHCSEQISDPDISSIIVEPVESPTPGGSDG